MRRAHFLAAMALWLAASAALAQQTLTVAADTSLAAVLSLVAREFEARQPGLKLTVVPGAPGAFVAQLAQGQALDVLVSADLDSLALGVQRRLLLADVRGAFASDALVLVVPAATTGPVQRLADLARPDVARIALGRPASVPAGRHARDAINGQRLWTSVQRKVVYADTVAALLDRVANAEVEAGLVYASDAAAAAGRVRVVQVLPVTPPIRYEARVVAGSRNAELAREFATQLRSAAAQAALAKAGFGPP